MNGIVTLRPHARTGNQLFQYCFARAYARRVGAQLQTTPWIGQQIFKVDDPQIERRMPPRYDMDFEKWDGETNIELTGWTIHQKCLIYTREDAKSWLRFKPWVQAAHDQVERVAIASHLRHSDFVSLPDYIAVSRESYLRTCDENGLDRGRITFVSEDNPTEEEEMTRAGLGFLPDFSLLMRAHVLLRANSTFSWWAHTLGENERVFAPRLDGITPMAGITQDVPFSEGNWPAISLRHPNCSDLHLNES